ncbi:MAG: leucine-rich repeat protein, partial [Eubacteriaceae bacterium]|nr:leucine-rich repeat protein [Eubacteriaceae bacterium]
MKIIGSRAFFGCENAKTIILPDTLEQIEEEAFGGCSSLELIDLP